MTICPCCGFKFVGALSNGCPDCGARSVGEALPRPDHQLPSYGRALLLTITGSLVVLVFLTQTVIAMFQRSFKSLGFWAWIAAGETAAWRLKWISLPVMMLVLWLGLRLYRSIKSQPDRFCGVKYARGGLMASATVGLLIATLIGVTVPARLRQREMASYAGTRAFYYTYSLAQYRYQLAYKTHPDQANLKEQLAKLPDPDGSIAALLRELDTAGYEPRADIAAVGKPKSAKMGGMAIRPIGFNPETDDATPAGLGYTNYAHQFAGEDKILGNEDDWIVRDGMVLKVSEIEKKPAARTNSANKP